MAARVEDEGAIICLAFRNTGRCRYGDACKYRHVAGGAAEAPPSWHVSGVPVGATAEDVSAAFAAATALAGFDTALHARGGNAAHPYAHVTAGHAEAAEHDAALVANGVVICGVVSGVKRRKESKHDRVAEGERRLAAKKAAQAKREQRRPLWQMDNLEKLPWKGTTLDKHAQVAAQPRDVLDMIGVYLGGAGSPGGVAALRLVWEAPPTSLRVKELFETLETFKLLYRQLSIIRARAVKRQQPNTTINHVYDMACGHGLLGVLVAERFPAVRVVCVDLEKRPGFEHYCAAFRAGAGCTLANLEFVEGDLAEVAIQPQSFVVSVHACNEANKVTVAMAVAADAAYAAMPCCIRDGLYDAVHSVRHMDDATRYAIMVGVMAQAFNAHTVSAIDRRITNRHLIMFGGYERATEQPQSKATTDNHD